jgi:hypothetical protein
MASLKKAIRSDTTHHLNARIVNYNHGIWEEPYYCPKTLQPTVLWRMKFALFSPA